MPLPDARTYQGPSRTNLQLLATARAEIDKQRKALRIYAEVLIADEEEFWFLYEHFTRLRIYDVKKTTLGYSRNTVIISWKP